MIEEETIQESEQALLDAIDTAYDNSPSEDVKEETKKSDDSRENEQQDDVEVEDTEEEEKEKLDEEDKPEEDENKIDPTPQVKLPENMPKDLKDVLEKIEDKNVIQSQIDVFKKMEASMQRKSQELSKERKFATDINNVFSKYGKEAVQDKIAMLDGHLNFEKTFIENPELAFKTLFKAANINPEDFLNKIIYEKENSTDQERKLQQELQETKSRLNSYEKYNRNNDKVEVDRQIQEFSEAKDEKGELKHPYFEDLREEMISLANFDNSLTIDKLYDKALRLNDDLFNKSLASKKTVNTSKEKLKKARKISKQNIKSRPSNTISTDYEAKLRADLDSLF